MNDLEYDALQKKRIARSAYAKKSGSKSKKCTLPSDWLTESQRKKLNGEVMTYQINKPITWAEFKNYPIDIKKKYLEHFAEEHDCTISMMEKMFGCGANAVRSHIDGRPELQNILRKASTRETRLKFDAWIETERKRVAEPDQSEAEAVTEQPQEKVAEKPAENLVFKFNNCVKSGRFVVKGTPNEIGVALFNIFQDHCLSATIHFEVIE